MSLLPRAFLNSEIWKRTAIFGLRLWVVISIVAAVVILLILLSLSSLRRCRRRRRRHPRSTSAKLFSVEPSPPLYKDFPDTSHQHHRTPAPPASADVKIGIGNPDHSVAVPTADRPRVRSASMTGTSSGERSLPATPLSPGGPPEVSHLGWGHWYTLRDIEEATNGLAEENVIGEGGYGIVYHGILADKTSVAIKNLLNNKGQAEKEFKVEVEVIGRVRHKNLVRLLGYCVEGAYRMLVYEYVDNGNLEQWLNGEVGDVSPLTWEIRMNIILGTARGLAYLHEGLEPKVVHRDVKSSNILLDKHWNPKVSDFGLAKLLCSERSYVTTRVMGTFGYVAPEYASSGMLNERSDVYSFGVLIMEIISGRSPVDYTRPPGEVHLVEWLKTMVGDRKSELVVDPRMPEKPSSKSLKRALLVALRCVDPDAHRRPKMGHLIHLLEVDDLPVREDHKQDREVSRSRRHHSHGKQSSDRYNASEEESFAKHDASRWR